LSELENRLNPLKISEEKMKDYVGVYGPRRIYMEDGILYYHRDNRPRYKMFFMGDDTFRFEELDYFRISFERDKSGGVVKILGIYRSGQTDENSRNK
jgi:hypothetical protein